jgi:hypothetical protein
MSSRLECVQCVQDIHIKDSTCICTIFTFAETYEDDHPDNHQIEGHLAEQ